MPVAGRSLEHYACNSTIFFTWVLPQFSDSGSQVIVVSDRGWLVTSSSPVPLKTRLVEERCTLNLWRTQTSSHWCGVVVRKGGANSSGVLVT
ncbi:hypothetical protein TNCV_203371 [Trichonephila clavipes]|nr:hypothetical protein TNCV_203371 [Trichonephila clavipes]